MQRTPVYGIGRNVNFLKIALFLFTEILYSSFYRGRVALFIQQRFSTRKQSTMSAISPFSVVSPDAQIGNNVEIGHFCIIESGVTIGHNCKLASHVVIKSGVTIGDRNEFGEGTVIGGTPQHVSAPPPFGQIRIGDGNVFREHVTVHSSLKESGTTLIGNDNYFMVNAHVAHDCIVGNSAILINNVMLGGQVIIGNRAMLGGGAAVHQNCQVGSLAMIGGQAHIVQDVPPFVTVDGLSSKVVGLNLIGLRRNGRTSEDMKTLKSAYFSLYRSGMTWKEILQFFQDNYATGPVAELTQFLLSAKRGILRERAAASSSLRVVDAGGPADGDTPIAIRATG